MHTHTHTHTHTHAHTITDFCTNFETATQNGFYLAPMIMRYFEPRNGMQILILELIQEICIHKWLIFVD